MAVKKKQIERRLSTIRRDLNDIVRSSDGKFSPEKIGSIVGQFYAIYALWTYGAVVLGNWDVLTVLFLVLIAPDVARKAISMKYGSGGQK